MIINEISRTLRKSAKAAVVIAVGFALVVPALAHPRHRHHRHHHRHHVIVAPRPVIVFGTARPASRVVYVSGTRAALVDMNIKPKSTAVYVDGRYRGTTGDFDGLPQKLHLRPGRHTIKLVTPDGQIYREKVELRAGTEVDVRLDLR